MKLVRLFTILLLGACDAAIQAPLVATDGDTDSTTDSGTAPTPVEDSAPPPPDDTATDAPATASSGWSGTFQAMLRRHVEDGARGMETEQGCSGSFVLDRVGDEVEGAAACSDAGVAVLLTLAGRVSGDEVTLGWTIDVGDERLEGESHGQAGEELEVEIEARGESADVYAALRGTAVGG